ncbi:PTS sugar transporter subunit IIB [soil metagenome]
MPIVLIRVDERLIHGQVVVGWGGRLQADRIVVIDDELALSSWEQELYRLGVPPEMEAFFVDVEEARNSVAEWRASPHRFILLVRNIPTLAALARDSLLGGEEVNLGGLHHATGRERHLPYLFLSSEERAALRGIAAAGVRIAARDVPTSRAIPLDELLRGDAG